MANTERQLDLFAALPPAPDQPALPSVPTPSIDMTALEDRDLLRRLPDADSRECRRLLGEIARRKTHSAVPAIEAIALRHIGFGRERVIPEQAASVEALVSIGGEEAREALGRLIMRRAFEGPCLKLAMTAAVQLDVRLPQDFITGILCHDDPEIRSAAANSTRMWPKAAPHLIELLDDLHDTVRIAAACALGRMGRSEARPILMRSLRQNPTEKVIEAVAGIWDEDIIVVLGRSAIERPDLAGAVLEALEAVDHPRARTVIAGIR